MQRHATVTISPSEDGYRWVVTTTEHPGILAESVSPSRDEAEAAGRARAHDFQNVVVLDSAVSNP